MTSYDPPSLVSSIFNDNNFTNLSGTLNIATADRRYLRLTGGNVVGNCTFKNISMNSLTTSDVITVNKDTGDLLKLQASSITGRSSILHTVPNNSLETGIRGSNEGTFPNTFYRYSNGQFRFLQELSTGNSFNYGSMSIIRDAGNQLNIASTDNVERTNILMTTLNNTLEIGIRNNTGSHPNSFYRHMNGNYRYVQNVNGNSQHFGQFLVDTSSNHLTLKNGSTTSNFSQSSTALTLSSTVSSATMSLDSIGFNIDSSSSHLTLKNSSNTAFLELTGSNSLRIVRGYAMNLNSSGLRLQSSSTADARCALDMGQQVADKVIIFNEPQTGGGDVYSIGCNNLNMIYSSGGGHRFCKSNSSPTVNATNLMNLDSNGNLLISNNVVPTKGMFIPQSSFSGAIRSGIGLGMHMVNSTYSEIFSYEYPAVGHKSIYMCNFAYFNGPSGSLNLGGGANASLYPLTVNGSSSGNIGTYGYLSQGGVAGQASTNPVPISIFALNRVACTEVNSYSDLRAKKDLQNIDLETAMHFVNGITPKSFRWRNEKDGSTQFGFIAQDILKLRNEKLDKLVSTVEDKEMVESIDADGFVNPKDNRFIVSYQQTAVLLHVVVKDLLKRIDKLETRDKKKELMNR